MRYFTALLAALSLTFGMTQAISAHAQATSQQSTASSASCSAPAFTWQHLGGAPFAHSEAEAMAKLPKALNDMVAAGCLPAGAVPGVLKHIKDTPNGDVAPGNPPLITLNNGMKLNFMESAHHPYMNVTVGIVSVGRGLVAGVQAKVWAFTYSGVRYYLYMPLICYNWSLQMTQLQVAPKPTNECDVIRTPFATQKGDRANHFGFYGPDAMQGSCFAWRYEGETNWHSYQECPDDACTYDAITREVNGMRLAFKGRTNFAPPSGARYVEYRVSKTFAERTYNGASVNLAVLCRELASGIMSCGKMVRHDDYHGGVATIYRSLDDYKSANATGRVLVWDFFEDPRDCLKKWTH